MWQFKVKSDRIKITVSCTIMQNHKFVLPGKLLISGKSMSYVLSSKPKIVMVPKVQMAKNIEPSGLAIFGAFKLVVHAWVLTRANIWAFFQEQINALISIRTTTGTCTVHLSIFHSQTAQLSRRCLLEDLTRTKSTYMQHNSVINLGRRRQHVKRSIDYLNSLRVGRNWHCCKISRLWGHAEELLF